MFGIGWESADGTIVTRRLVGKHTERDSGEFAGQGVETYEYIVDVRPGDGSEPFRALVKEPFNAITFKAPEVGQDVFLKFERTHDEEPKVKFDRADPGTYEHVPSVPGS